LAIASTLLAAVVFAGRRHFRARVQASQTLRNRVSIAALAAAGLALILETAKLFVLARGPDAGNVVIAGLGRQWAICWLRLQWQCEATGASKRPSMRQCSRARRERPSARDGASLGCCSAVQRRPSRHVSWADRHRPRAFATLLPRPPSLVAVVVPAMLPVFDLTPWTDVSFDEFDACCS
jgi:hypothetical protein